MYSDDDRTHTEFHLDRRSFGVTNLWFSLNFDFPKIGLFTLRIILCASVDLFSTISSINKLFKIYRGTLIITEDIIDDGDDRRHSWVVLCFNKIGQTNIYPQYEHGIKPVKGAIKIIEHERWANQSFLNLRGRIKPLFGQIRTRKWPHFGRNRVRIRSIRARDPVSFPRLFLFNIFIKTL